MTPFPRLTLTAPRGQALAESVRLAFETRGADLTLVPASLEGDFRLTLRREDEGLVILRDPVAMLELADDLHPDQPLHPRDPVRRAEHRQALAQIPNLARHLDKLIRSTDPRDVDLYTHFLLAQIGPLAGLLGQPWQSDRTVSLLDIAAVPLLWRMDALDRSCETHLLAGHDHLRHRQDWLNRHPQLCDVLDSSLLADWLQMVFAQGGLITQADAVPDWSTAFGPTDPSSRKENSLPPAQQRTKVHSIGSAARLR